MARTIDIMQTTYSAFATGGALSSKVGGRMYPGFAPSESPTLPYITYWPISTTSARWAMTASGPQAEEKVRLQFDIYTDARSDPSPIQAFEIADQLEQTFDWLTRSGGAFNNATFRREQYRPQREEQMWRLTIDYLVTVWGSSPVNN